FSTLTIRRQPTSTLFPYTTLFRSFMDQPHERLIFQVVAPRNARLLVRVAVGNELTARRDDERVALLADLDAIDHPNEKPRVARGDRKSTRLNSSHSQISYAVFCLK